MSTDGLSEAPSFSAFFEAAWGQVPFAWQADLAAAVADPDRGWPALLDVPTGLGKTASLDVFVWHLATQAHLRPEERTAPIRAAFVIDRRLVVDSAFERLRALTRTLANSKRPEIVAVAERLRSIGGNEYPLVVQRMRGGISWEANWVRRPDQPAVVCGTVDQVGSRLLSRGYGSSHSRMPIDCGLLGADCLLLLDEAHLSSALVATVRGVAGIERRAPSPVLPGRPTSVVRLTATPQERSADEVVLSVNSESPDAINGAGAPRLTAVKRASLLKVAKASEVADQIAEVAAALIGDSDRVVLVVVNTVATARAVFDQARAAAHGGVDVYLLIGRCRQLERNASERAWMERAKAGRVRSKDDRPLIVVATQTVEVGVDLDVDVLVTEVAAVDALVQRFGRLDRLGFRGDTRSVIVGCPARLGDDPVYGSASKATWDLLADVAEPIELARTTRSSSDISEQIARASWFDAGPLAFRRLVDSAEDRRPLLAEVSPAPVVIPQTLACWIRTSPIPEPDESVAPYLHGVDRDDPTVSVAWRAAVGVQALAESVGQFPIRGEELVEIPLRTFMRFMRSTTGERAEVLSDVEGATSSPEEEAGRYERARDLPELVVVRSRTEIVGSGGDLRADEVLRQVRPGDVVVLSSAAGGHDDHGWSGLRRGAGVPDIADIVERSRLRLRLDAEVLRSLGVRSAEIDGWLRPFRRIEIGSDASADVTALLAALREAVAASAERGPALAALDVLLGHLSTYPVWHAEPERGEGATVVCDPDADEEDFGRGVALVAALVPVRESEVDEGGDALWGSAVGDDGEDSSMSGSHGRSADRTLGRHCRDVAERAAEFAANVGVGSALIDTLRFAGFLHDLGKADVRFQALLRRGDIVAARAAADDFAQQLAKSDIDSGDFDAALAATKRSSWPRLRHEAISLALARTWPHDLVPSEVDLDLALHLVATHHGHARPWFPADRADNHPEVVRIELDGRHLPLGSGAGQVIVLEASSSSGVMAFDQPARLERLREHYGFWGLSYLEALLRLADVTVSEELSAHIIVGGGHG